MAMAQPVCLFNELGHRHPSFLSGSAICCSVRQQRHGGRCLRLFEAFPKG
jgi:hypothetical protein